MSLVHQHILVRATVTNAPKSEEAICEWLTKLVKNIDMNICIPPRAYYVYTEGNRGLTAQVGIETSHIAIHIWDDVEPGLVQMDLYSCKCFNNKAVIEALHEWDIVNCEYLVIDRENGFKLIGHDKI